MFRRLVVPLAGLLLSVATTVWGQAAPVDLDSAFRAYWAASDSGTIEIGRAHV